MSDLYNDRDYFDTKFGNIDGKFGEIMGRLDKLNGNVARHEKIINEHLPHSIDHCPQVKVIEELQKNIITSKAVKKTIYVAFGIFCALIGALWGIKELFL